MSTAAWVTTVGITGTSTTFTTEACSGATTAWQITNTAKRVFDPAQALSWYDNAVLISGSDIVSVNWLTGQVVFTAGKTGPITVSGKYLPILTYTEARSAEVSIDAAALDASVFGSQYHTYIQGLIDVSGSFENLALPGYDMDPGAGTRSLSAIAAAGTQVVLQISPDGGTSFYKFWAVLFNLKTDAKVADLVVVSGDFKSVDVTAADGSHVNVSFG